jgi:glycosyltransferase involved in cell wall biosynthesis
VVCDDCSTDATWLILADYEQKDRRIRCYLNETNLGPKKNFEKALGLCIGEYIALSDQDDVWTDDHLEVLHNNIDGNQVCCGSFVIINGKGERIGKSLDDYWGDISSLDHYSRMEYFLYQRSPYLGMAMLLRKSFVDIGLPIPENIESHDAWFFCLSDSCLSFKYIPAIINNYRKHDTNYTPPFRLGFFRRIHFTLMHIFFSRRRLNRLAFCTALLRKDFDIDHKMRQLLIEAKSYYENNPYFLYRLTHLAFWIKHYDIIFGQIQSICFYGV